MEPGQSAKSPDKVYIGCLDTSKNVITNHLLPIEKPSLKNISLFSKNRDIIVCITHSGQTDRYFCYFLDQRDIRQKFKIDLLGSILTDREKEYQDDLRDDIMGKAVILFYKNNYNIV